MEVDITRTPFTIKAHGTNTPWSGKCSHPMMCVRKAGKRAGGEENQLTVFELIPRNDSSRMSGLMGGLSEPVPESGTPPLRCEGATNLFYKHHSFAPVEELACFRRIQIQSATCSRPSYTAWRQGLITTKPALVRLSILHSVMPASTNPRPFRLKQDRFPDSHRFEIDLSLILQVATPLSIHKLTF